jgi:hypothetical protein
MNVNQNKLDKMDDGQEMKAQVGSLVSRMDVCLPSQDRGQ